MTTSLSNNTDRVAKCLKGINTEVKNAKYPYGNKDYKDIMISLIIEENCKNYGLNKAKIRLIYFGKLK